MHPGRFAGGFPKTPLTHPWGLSHKIPLVRVSERLLRSALVASGGSFLSALGSQEARKNAIVFGLLGPHRMSVQQASQEGPCEAVPRDGFTTFAEHSSCAARGLPYEAAKSLALPGTTATLCRWHRFRSEEHTSELQSLLCPCAAFCENGPRPRQRSQRSNPLRRF